jgi:hypothetical protein
VALIYFGTVALFAGLQRHLIYFPSRALASEEKMARIAAPLGLEPWHDSQGQRIGWRQMPPPNAPAGNRMVVFHGNAGCAFDRSQYAAGFGHLDAGQTWQVYLFEYPGYGGRPGVPGQESFCAAGRAAIEQLAMEDSRPIFLAGESLGSGPACALAGEMPQKVAGLFLMTPFATLGEVAAHHFPWLPVNLILRDRWDNAAALRRYHGPVAVMLAGEDEVVTMAQGQKLFDGYTGPKRHWIDPEATHNTVSNSAMLPWWREVSDFLIESGGPRLSPR